MPARTSILFLIPSLVAHGAERQLCELVRNMDHDRYDIHVAAFYGPASGSDVALWSEVTAQPGVRLHDLDKRRGILGYAFALPRLLLLVLRVRPDILHGYMDGNLPALLIGGLLRKRVVWGIRRSSKDLTKMDRLSRLLLRLMIWLSRFVDLVIFNSESGRHNYTAMGMKAPRMEVVPNGFDTVRFEPNPARGALQKRAWGIAPDAPLIGIVGRLDAVKDHPTFLRAAARLAQRNSEARFICVGGGPEHYKAFLQEMARSLGIEGKVHFPGPCEGMAATYNALSILVLSSTDEGFPNVLGEAMACGIPCVSTRVGDAQALLGPWGITVEPGDDRGIAEALATLLRESPQEQSARADGSRAHICASFSVQTLAANTERILLGLVPSPWPAHSQTGFK